MDDNLATSDLLARMRQGDVGAAAALFAGYSGRFYRNARNHGLNHQDAEDAVQQAFHNILEGAHTYDQTRGSGEQWIWGICRNAQFDIFRRQGRIVDLPPGDWPDPVDPDPSPQKLLEQRDEMRIFHRCWDKLSPVDRNEIKRGRGMRGPARIVWRDAVGRLRTCMELAA